MSFDPITAIHAAVPAALNLPLVDVSGVTAAVVRHGEDLSVRFEMPGRSAVRSGCFDVPDFAEHGKGAGLAIVDAA